MPVSLITNRRRFLSTTGSAAASTLIGGGGHRTSFGDEPDSNETHIALLSDTHIPGVAWGRHRGAHMAGNLQRVVKQVRESTSQTTPVIVNGDCAFLKGKPGDYKMFATLIAPFVTDGRDVHLTMGNHDDREVCFKRVTAVAPRTTEVIDKHACMIETPHANLFLLDSLRKVDHVTGELGKQQIAWLSDSLDACRDKPAMVVAHHNLQTIQRSGETVTGMLDSQALLDTMTARPWVRLFLYGHNHRWQQDALSPTLAAVNLPSTAYVFDKGQPSGWVHATITDTQCTLKLHSIKGEAENQPFVIPLGSS